MRIDFKSLIMLHEYSTKNFMGDVTMTGMYDLASVCDHTLEVSRLRLLFHPGIPVRMLFFGTLPWLLFLVWAQFDPLAHPYVFFIPSLAVAGFVYYMAYVGVTNLEMEQLARRERRLPSGVRISCIKMQHWPLFLSRLKEPGSEGRFALWLDQQKRSLEAQKSSTDPSRSKDHPEPPAS